MHLPSYINSTKIHLPFLLRLIKSEISTSNKSAIVFKVYKSGWLTLVHHLETVDGFFPNSSANHLLVFFFSTSTTLRRFKSTITHEL